MSIHKLRRQLTAANKKLKWYEAHFETFPSTRRRRRAYMRRMVERDNIRMNLAMERAIARVPVPLNFERGLLDWLSPMSEERRGYHIPFRPK